MTTQVARHGSGGPQRALLGLSTKMQWNVLRSYTRSTRACSAPCYMPHEMQRESRPELRGSLRALSLSGPF